MFVRIKETGYVVDVCGCSDDPNHFYVIGENGRTISDYDISEIEFLDDEEINT